MRSVLKGESVIWSSGGIGKFVLSGLPSGSVGNMVPYLTKIEIVMDWSATVGNGGQAVTALQLANLLSKCTMDVAGGPWGPVNMSGEQLRIHNFFQSGKSLPFAANSAGDTGAANNAGAITRKVRHVYSFEALGPKDDPWAFCPPCAALRTGNVNISMGTLITNTTNTATSFQIYFHVVWRSEAQSVSRVRTLAQAFGGSGQSILQSGLLLRLIAHNITADFSAGDITPLQFYKDGVQLLDILDPMDERGAEYYEVAKVTSALLQESFADPLGGNFVRAVNVYPLHGPREKMGDLPVGDNFKYQFGGAGTTANEEWIFTVAEKQSDEHIRSVLGGCGCNVAELVPGSGAKGATIPSAAVIVPRGPGGGVLTSSRLNGFTPTTQVARSSALARVAANLGVSK